METTLWKWVIVADVKEKDGKTDGPILTRMFLNLDGSLLDCVLEGYILGLYCREIIVWTYYCRS